MLGSFASAMPSKNAPLDTFASARAEAQFSRWEISG
jgi:hypothetical protein